MSVVVPVFNGMPHLSALVDSLLHQDYPNLEFVFAEGGGSDDSARYLASLTDSRIRLISMPLGTAAAENWTAVTRAARGEFIKLVCQDDLIYPSAISDQVDDLQGQPSAVMAIARRDIIDANGTVLFRGRGLAGLHGQTGQVISGSALVRTCYVQGTNVIGEPLAVLFRAADLLACLPWSDENPLMLDLTMYQRVAAHGSAVLRYTPVGAFRVSASSWSTRIARSQLQQTKIWQRTYAESPGVHTGLPDRIRAMVGRHVHTFLRRGAYASLRLRRRMSTARSAS